MKTMYPNTSKYLIGEEKHGRIFTYLRFFVSKTERRMEAAILNDLHLSYGKSRGVPADVYTQLSNLSKVEKWNAFDE